MFSGENSPTLLVSFSESDDHGRPPSSNQRARPVTRLYRSVTTPETRTKEESRNTEVDTPVAGTPVRSSTDVLDVLDEQVSTRGSSSSTKNNVCLNDTGQNPQSGLKWFLRRHEPLPSQTPQTPRRGDLGKEGSSGGRLDSRSRGVEFYSFTSSFGTCASAGRLYVRSAHGDISRRSPDTGQVRRLPGVGPRRDVRQHPGRTSSPSLSRNPLPP